MTRIIITGSKGRMGRALLACAAGHPGLEVAGQIDADDDLAAVVGRADVVVDFSSHAATPALAAVCAANNKAMVIGTTGHSDQARAEIDALFGGARRDEEKARAKERVFSFRDEFGQWDPKNQRPELWSLYNTRLHRGEHIRVFPLSNWTELDVWSYIERESLEIPSIYFSHRRQVFERDGLLLADNPYVARGEDEPLYEAVVRYRTVGDMTCTGAVPSAAVTVAEVIAEVAATRITERGQTRADDRTSEAAMEDRKREGYF